MKLHIIAASSLALLGYANANVGKLQRDPSSVSPSTPTITYEAKLGGEQVCLTEINAARQAASLTAFAEAKDTNTRLPEASGNKWNGACEYIMTGEPGDEHQDFKHSTYALYKLLTPATGLEEDETTPTPDCNAAVQRWKAAYGNFNGLPPAANDELYENPDNSSFVALYNPQTPPVADCRVVTCTKKTASAEQRAVYTDENEEKASVLLCRTSPDALFDADGKTLRAPFTEEQWKKISAALGNSASAALPSLLVVGAVALGLSLL